MSLVFRNQSLKIFIFFISSLIYVPFNIYTQEVWNNIDETTKGNGYSKQVLTLALQTNYLQYRPAQKDKSLQILVMISQKGRSEWYFKTILDKFNPKISVLEYKLDYKIREEMFASQNVYQKTRVKQYIKKGNLTNIWPPLHPETVEIKKELEQNKYDKKYLLLTGTQSQVLINSTLLNEFDQVIIVSPDNFPDDMNNEFWQNKKILWIGSDFEKGMLEGLQAKFGGKILTYRGAFRGQNLLMRNQKVLDDILDWMNN